MREGALVTNRSEGLIGLWSLGSFAVKTSCIVSEFSWRNFIQISFAIKLPCATANIGLENRRKLTSGSASIRLLSH